MKTISKLAIHFHLFVCAAWLCGCGTTRLAMAIENEQSAGPAEKNLDRVSASHPPRKSLKLFTTQPARIQAFERAPLASKLSGYIGEVLVEIGDRVKADQPLLRLDMPELRDEVRQKEALLAQSKAEVSQAEAELQAAKAAADSKIVSVAVAEAGVGRSEGDYERWLAETNRIKELSSRGSVTPKLFEEANYQLRSADAGRRESAALVLAAKAAVNEATANVARAEADLNAAAATQRVTEADLAKSQTMLGYVELRAPFDGVITQRTVDRGQYVTGGTEKPLLVVERADKLRVVVDVPELDAPLVTAGEQGDAVILKVQALANREFNAKVSRTSWSLDEANHSLRTEIDIPNSDATLRSGMYASASILLEQRNEVLTLPLTAILRDDSAVYCCLVVSGKIERRVLELGLRSGDEVEVMAGLDATDKVVLTRAAGLQTGQEVVVIEPKK